MITFKQFLTEGGAATAEFETVRATAKDIDLALKFVEKHTGILYSKLKDNLLGSTSHTLAGKKKDSGDLDIALEDGMFDRDEIVKKMQAATGMTKVHQTGGNVFSFAVPVGPDRRVQVDLMFVPSETWAKFGYHSALNSKYKGAVRNLLLVSVVKHIFEPGKDISVKDRNGDEVVRVRRGFKMDGGLERLFRVAPMRKDGKGRVALRKGTAAEVETLLRQLGRDDKFSKEADTIMNPDKAAEFMFGKGVKASDLLSAEQVIEQIKKLPNREEIFKDAAKSIEDAGFDVPDELSDY